MKYFLKPKDFFLFKVHAIAFTVTQEVDLISAGHMFKGLGTVRWDNIYKKLRKLPYLRDKYSFKEDKCSLIYFTRDFLSVQIAQK